MPVTSINKNKLREIPYLINRIKKKHDIFEGKPKCALLIGAGCSYTSGLPLGSGIIDICQKLSFLRNHTTDCSDMEDRFYKSGDITEISNHLADPKYQDPDDKSKRLIDKYIAAKEEEMRQKVLAERAIEEEKLKQYLGNFDWQEYEESVVTDDRYGFWMNELSEEPKERQRMIEALIEKTEPGGAYILLAYLIERGIFNNILTTNFDDLINDSLSFYTDVKCRFYASDDLSQYISLYGSKPNIIKLHGDYRFANIKNTAEETLRLSGNLEPKVGELLNQFSIVVVGYNGADHSIMNILKNIKQKHKYELIWCDLFPDKTHWRVADLINNTDNSFFVPIKGFNELMTLLYPHFPANTQPKSLVDKATERQKGVDKVLAQFNTTMNENKNLTDEQKDKFNQSAIVDKLFNEALTEKDPDKKIDLYNRVLQIEPEYEHAYNNRGISWYEKKEYEKSIEDYTKAISIKSEYADFYFNRGISWAEKKEYEKAIEDYTKAISLKSTDGGFYYNRGNCWASKKNYDSAIDDYNKAIAQNPDYASAYYNRGNIWNEKKEYDKAIDDYSKALALRPEDADSYNSVADLYRKKGELDTASEKVTQALQKFPGYFLLHATLAEIYSQQGKTEDFYTSLEKALELGAPVWNFLEDPAYTPHKNEQRFIDLLARYRKEEEELKIKN
jgi:tetratricopeptide (TPR) repeat protein